MSDICKLGVGLPCTYSYSSQGYRTAWASHITALQPESDFETWLIDTRHVYLSMYVYIHRGKPYIYLHTRSQTSLYIYPYTSQGCPTAWVWMGEALYISIYSESDSPTYIHILYRDALQPGCKWGKPYIYSESDSPVHIHILHRDTVQPEPDYKTWLIRMGHVFLDIYVYTYKQHLHVMSNMNESCPCSRIQTTRHDSYTYNIYIHKYFHMYTSFIFICIFICIRVYIQTAFTNEVWYEWVMSL